MDTGRNSVGLRPDGRMVLISLAWGAAMAVRVLLRKSVPLEDGMIELGIIGAGIMGERLARAALEHAGDSVRLAGIWDPSAYAMAHIGAALPGLPH